jgi:hypothetical protein
MKQMHVFLLIPNVTETVLFFLEKKILNSLRAKKTELEIIVRIF